MPTSYVFPIIRLGNEKNPKLIILLENPNSYPALENIKLNPGYVMQKEGVYSKTGMSMSKVIEYDAWWFELANFWKDYLNDDDILALEFYPYATSKDNKNEKNREIYPTKNDPKWNEFAEKALESNVQLLCAFMEKETPIFVYYKSKWETKVKKLKKLKSYDNDKIAYGNIRHPKAKGKKLKEFLIDLKSKGII